jgi:hypothetical protein
MDFLGPELAKSQRSLNAQQAALLAYITSQRTEIHLGTHDSRLSRAVEWTLSTQRTSGAWGNEDVATTASMILSLSSLTKKGIIASDPRLTAAINSGITCLEQQYATNRWELAVWDTALATSAIHTVDADAALLARLRDWLLRPETPRTFGPHHHAQRLLTLNALGVHRDRLVEIRDEMMLSMPRGIDPYSPYVQSQVLQASCVLGTDNDEVRGMADGLEHFLANTRLDSANFLNVCFSLRALKATNDPERLKATRLATAGLFADTSFRDNGSWYRSEISTAWALMTVGDYSRELIVSAPYYEVLHHMEDSAFAASEVIRHQNATHRRATAYFVLAAAVLGTVLGVFVGFSATDTNMPDWLAWILGSVVTAGLSSLVAASRWYWSRMPHRLQP